MAKFSVCLPVFNGRRYLRAAIETVLAQTHGDFELLISDDVSTDDSYEIAEEFAKRDKRIVLWRNEKNVGLFPNYNVCIERATGDFIKLFAQDDLFVPKMLETHLSFFEKNGNVTMVTGARNIIGDDGVLTDTLGQFDEDRVIPGEEVIESNISRYFNWVGEPSCVSFRAEMKGTGFDTTLFHYGDIEYWFRLVENGSLYYTSKPLCSFRRHEGSATRRNMRSMNFIADLAYIGDKYKDFLERRGITRDKYWTGMIETINSWVFSMVDDEGLTEPDSSDLINANQYDPETLRRLLAAMRYATMKSLYVLRMDKQRTGSLVKDLEDELFAQEEKIAEVLNSKVSRATTAVRNVLNKFS